MLTLSTTIRGGLWRTSSSISSTSTLEINGTRHRLSVPASATLLDVLRERLQLYGTKKGCDLGACGACTVLVDGRRANACLMLAAMQDGRRIATIEGVRRVRRAAPVAAGLHRARRAAMRLLHAGPDHVGARADRRGPRGGSDAEIAEHMSGNLCRCGAYPNIVAAIAEARRGAEAWRACLSSRGERGRGAGARRGPSRRRVHRRRHRPAAARASRAGRAGAADRHQPPAARPHRRRAAPPSISARWRAWPMSPTTPRSDAPAGAGPGDRGQRLAAGAQPRDRRRQPAAAHPLRLLPQHRPALQQASARFRLRGPRRREPAARDLRREPALRGDARLRPGGGAAGAGARVHVHGPEASARAADRRAVPPARRHAAARQRARRRAS